MGNDGTREQIQDQRHPLDIESGVNLRPRERLLAKLITGQTIAVACLTAFVLNF